MNHEARTGCETLESVVNYFIAEANNLEKKL